MVHTLGLSENAMLEIFFHLSDCSCFSGLMISEFFSLLIKVRYGLSNIGFWLIDSVSDK